MGRYRLGDIVRMTRKSLGITQEQLCNDICSAETLSRIENGNQTPTRDTYELLMERMGRIRSRAYSVLSVSDLKVLEKMKQFEDYIKLYDFNQANLVLDEIKNIIGNSSLDKQFLYRAESLVNYFQKRINSKEFLETFQKAIKLTIPKYGTISLSKWPISINEAKLLLNISTAHAEAEDYIKAIATMEDAYLALKESYMDDEQRAILMVTIATNLSKWYGLTNNNEKAIEIINEGISGCKKYKLGHALPYLLYGLAWNKEQLIERGVLPSGYIFECLAEFKKAYYIASSMQLSYIAELIAEHIRSKYKEYPNVLY